MRGGRLLICLSAALLLSLTAGRGVAYAQFKQEAFSQNYSTDDEPQSDADTSSIFSVKNYVKGLTHKMELKTGTLAIGSSIFVGGWQIYNRDYWKLPIVYGGIGAGVGLGLAWKNEGKKDLSTLAFAGAGLVYWATMLDGVINYPSDQHPHPGKSALYSLMFPGLGQIYNGESWKLPLYWGMLLGAGHFYDLNRTNYRRFRDIYIKATDTETSYTGPISADVALYYRDIYRRYRDYSLACIIAFYLIQVIDANVFAFMQDFKVSDDLTMSVTPTLLTEDMQFAHASAGGGVSRSCPGLSLGLRF